MENVSTLCLAEASKNHEHEAILMDRFFEKRIVIETNKDISIEEENEIADLAKRFVILSQIVFDW